MKENDLRKQISKELTSPSKTLVESFGEIALDSQIAEGVLREIPVVKTLFAFGQAGLAVNNALFLKKVARFLNGLAAYSDSAFVRGFRKRLDDDPNFEAKVCTRVIEFVDKSFDDQRLDAFANLFRSFADEKLSWDEFQDLSFALTQISPMGYDGIKQFASLETPFSTHKRPDWECYVISAGIADREGSHLTMNARGKRLFEFAIKDLP